MKKISILLGSLTILMLSGCTGMINDSFRAVDNAWSIENQQQAEQQRNRRFNSSYENIFEAVKKTYDDLNMPINKESLEKGYIISRNEAPKPLNRAQWEDVRKVENPKLEKITSLLSLPEKPEGQFVTIKSTIKRVESQTSVNLEYYLDMPEYEDMGYIPSKEAPPHAIKLMTEMFWKQLDNNLSE